MSATDRAAYLREYHREYHKRRTPEQKQAQAAREKAWRARRKAAGVPSARDLRKARGQCIDCDDRNDGVHVRCAVHHAKMLQTTTAARARPESRAKRLTHGAQSALPSGARHCLICGAQLGGRECTFCDVNPDSASRGLDHYGAQVALTARTKG